MSQFESQIPFFLETFLSRPASALPKGAQWVLMFEGVFNSGVNTAQGDVLPVKAIKEGIKYEPKTWDIDGSIDTTLIKDYQTAKGCLFVQAVQLPGESNIANPEGLQQSGYIRTFTGGGRDSFETLKISFLDTNVSFADNVMRPWVIATSHLGMIAREGDKNYRGVISVYRIGVISQDQPPFVAQKYTFYGVCPTNISGEEYNYSQTTTPINREVTFIYHYYTIDSVTSNNFIQDNTVKALPQSTPVRNENVEVVGVYPA